MEHIPEEHTPEIRRIMDLEVQGEWYNERIKYLEKVDRKRRDRNGAIQAVLIVLTATVVVYLMFEGVMSLLGIW